MPGSRPVVFVLGALAAAVLAGCGPAPRFNEDLQTRTQRQTYSQQITAIHADVAAGSIRVEGGERQSVTVERTTRWTGQEPRIEQRVEGNILVIDVSCPDGSDRCEVSYDIRVPADTAIRAKTGAGDVRVAGIAAPTELRSSAGKVTGTALRTGRVQASSSAGAVELTFAEPPQQVRARSSAGSVTVRVPRGSQEYQVVTGTSAGSTDVSVSTDPNASRVIRAYSDAGSITVAYRR